MQDPSTPALIACQPGSVRLDALLRLNALWVLNSASTKRCMTHSSVVSLTPSGLIESKTTLALGSLTLVSFRLPPPGRSERAFGYSSVRSVLRAAASGPATPADVARSCPLHRVAALVAKRRVTLLGPCERTSATELTATGWLPVSSGRNVGGTAEVPISSTIPTSGVASFLDTRQRGLRALDGRKHPHLVALLARHVVEGEPPEDVVDETRGDPQFVVVGDAGRLEAHVGVLAHVGRERHAVLETRG